MQMAILLNILNCAVNCIPSPSLPLSFSVSTSLCLSLSPDVLSTLSKQNNNQRAMQLDLISAFNQRITYTYKPAMGSWTVNCSSSYTF